MSEIMIDIETLAVPEKLPAGALVEVCQIGVVLFNGPDVMEQLNLFPHEGNGLCSADTVRWWMDQELKPEWVQRRRDGDTRPMAECLRELQRMVGYPSPWIWSKGGFDTEILRCHFAAARMATPWAYKHVRDLRTVLKEAEVTVCPAAVQHDALEDARGQVAQLHQAREKIRKHDWKVSA